VGTGRSWLRIGTGGGHLSVRRSTFEFHKNAVNFLTSCKLVSFSRRTVLCGVSKQVWFRVVLGTETEIRSHNVAHCVAVWRSILYRSVFSWSFFML
jgi:hypothetical protein